MARINEGPNKGERPDTERSPALATNEMAKTVSLSPQPVH